MNHFKFSEFDCNCNSCKSTGASGRVNMDSDFLERLDHARATVKGQTPFIITSGFRCEAHNTAVGGRKKSATSKGSSHMYGCAADIAATSSTARFNITQALIEAGFNRIGISAKGGFIHVDSDPDKSPGVLFLYPN
jgi:zinc D-Ala-D-Ala carboxypeptidase